MEGLVLSGSNGAFDVLCADKAIRRCVIKGKVLRDSPGRYNALAAGDRVIIDPENQAFGRILSQIARTSVFGRWNEKGQAQQAIAANVDLVVCVTSPLSPPFRPRFIDRVAIVAEASDLPLLVLLNKSDLGSSPDVDERLSDYERIGYETLRCSAGKGEGLEGLRKRIEGLTSAFVGQSGVGKSSIINALHPAFGLKVGEISEKHDRGRHTTTAGILLPLDDLSTRVADTPGFRRLAMRGIEPGELIAYFPELKPLAGACRHGFGCTHSTEPGCKLLEAVYSGVVHEDRFESFLRIRDELLTTKKYAKKAGRPRPRYDDEE